MPQKEPAESLLDLTLSELLALSDAQVNALTALARERVRHQAQYAKLGMTGSILVLLSCVAPSSTSSCSTIRPKPTSSLDRQFWR